ncbi:hypothetical protein ACERIT_09305 [Halopenitus sp. H-Gu1]|uniref:DUF7560 family zinc ribbon protein n=1 Tax=Halopenitus sp. H-Gu1 TaxID=3242697 RepID=UPI00359E1175
MSSNGGGEYAFNCPGCEESLVVNEPMKNALVESGCVICGTTVTPEAFTRTPPADSC